MDMNYMSLFTEVGSTIVYHGQGGWPAQKKAADEIFEVGDEREVLEIRLGNWESRVRVKEGWFNTCLWGNLNGG